MSRVNTFAQKDSLPITMNGIVYRDIFPKNTLFDPQDEDMLYGDELEEGMVVIVEDSRRQEKRDDLPSELVTGLLRDNRWCEVTKPRHVENGVYFIAVYRNGERMVRYSLNNTGWVVKRASIPVVTDTPYQFNAPIAKMFSGITDDEAAMEAGADETPTT